MMRRTKRDALQVLRRIANRTMTHEPTDGERRMVRACIGVIGGRGGKMGDPPVSERTLIREALEHAERTIALFDNRRR